MKRSEADIQRALGTDMDARDNLISEQCFCDRDYGYGGIRSFKNLTLEKLEKLIELGFCDPVGRQNDSPTAQQFLKFMQKYPDVKAHGYCIHRGRKDYRMTIEGLHLTVNETDLKDPAFKKRFSKYANAFKKFCKHANNLKVSILQGILHSWWD